MSSSFLIKKNLYWMAGVCFTALMLFFTEGSLIATTKVLGINRAALLRIFFTIPLSWLVIYLSTRAARSYRFQKWLENKEAGLSRRARAAVNGGKAVAVLNTAIFLGPIIASILMIMIGIEIRRTYLYAVFCAAVSAWAWCAFYSGMFWGLAKIF